MRIMSRALGVAEFDFDVNPTSFQNCGIRKQGEIKNLTKYNTVLFFVLWGLLNSILILM